MQDIKFLSCPSCRRFVDLAYPVFLYEDNMSRVSSCNLPALTPAPALRLGFEKAIKGSPLELPKIKNSFYKSNQLILKHFRKNLK